MQFSFLSPAALFLLLALPLLLVPYLLRQRLQRRVVPALFLYQDVSSPTRRRRWGRLRLSPLFLLQLLILLLLVASAGRPVLRYATTGKTALVLDTSASMQARAPSGRASLFEVAQERVQQELRHIPAGSPIGLFTTNPLGAVPAALLNPLAGPADSGGLVTTGADMPAVWERLRVSDAPDPSDATLSVFFRRLLRDRDFERVLFVTDRPVTQAPGGDLPGPAFRAVLLGAARPNIGISAFRLYRSPFFPDEIHATVAIQATPTGLSRLPPGQIILEDARTGRRLAARPLRQPTSQPFSFARLPRTATYRARILFDEPEEEDAGRGLDGEDGLGVDNEAYAVLPPLEEIAVLLVTPTPEVGDSLKQIPNLTLTLMTPQDYDPAAGAQTAGFRCILFHLTAPAALPPAPAAFFLPPDDNLLFALGRSARQPALTAWTHGHPLTAYVTFPLLAPAYAQALRPAEWNAPIIESVVGPLLLAGERAGRRYVATGFDLLPYLGTRNLPASILTLNILAWLSDGGSQAARYQTGAVLSPPAGTTGSPLHVRFPRDTRFQPVERALSLDRQGVYAFRENDEERLVAVNLLSPEETALGRPLSLVLTAPVGQARAPQASRARPVWPWLLLAVLVLCGLEWWWAARKDGARERE